MTNCNAPVDPASPSKLEDSATRPGVDRAVVLIVIVWAIAFIPILSVLTPPPNASPQRAATTINPNDAPWWELTALPRIGETTARKVTALRKQTKRQDGPQTAFNSPSDLQRVRGIGPKTVRRIAPFLHFRSSNHKGSDLASQN